MWGRGWVVHRVRRVARSARARAVDTTADHTVRSSAPDSGCDTEVAAPELLPPDLRVAHRLLAVTVASTTTITPSEASVGICGMPSQIPCAQCNTSFTPMKARITA